MATETTFKEKITILAKAFSSLPRLCTSEEWDSASLDRWVCSGSKVGRKTKYNIAQMCDYSEIILNLNYKRNVLDFMKKLGNVLIQIGAFSLLSSCSKYVAPEGQVAFFLQKENETTTSSNANVSPSDGVKELAEEKKKDFIVDSVKRNPFLLGYFFKSLTGADSFSAKNPKNGLSYNKSFSFSSKNPTTIPIEDYDAIKNGMLSFRIHSDDSFSVKLNLSKIIKYTEKIRVDRSYVGSPQKIIFLFRNGEIFTHPTEDLSRLPFITAKTFSLAGDDIRLIFKPISEARMESFPPEMLEENLLGVPQEFKIMSDSDKIENYFIFEK